MMMKIKMMNHLQETPLKIKNKFKIIEVRKRC